MAAIPGVGAIGSLSSILGGLTSGTAAASTGAAGAAGGSTIGAAAPGGISGPGGTSFADVAAQAVDSLQATQSAANHQALLAATGQGNVADLMISSTEATLDTQMTVALRDKAVDAFNQIMGMQF